MDWLAHPIVVATYVALLGLLVGAIKSVARLFHRVGKVEEGIDRVEEKVDDLSTDLRNHMVEESRTTDRLIGLMKSLGHSDDET